MDETKVPYVRTLKRYMGGIHVYDHDHKNMISIFTDGAGYMGACLEEAPQ